MYIYYCKKCNSFDAYKDMYGNYKCPKCNGDFLSLKISAEQWNSLSDKEMIDTIKSVKETQETNKQSRTITISRKAFVITIIAVFLLVISGIVIKTKVIDKPLNDTKAWTEYYIESINSGNKGKDFSTLLDTQLRMIKTNYENLSDSNKEKYDKWLRDQYGISYSNLSIIRYR